MKMVDTKHSGVTQAGSITRFDKYFKISESIIRVSSAENLIW
jgi:hypothetical protein